MDRYVKELREVIELIELAIDEEDGEKAHFILRKVHHIFTDAWIGWVCYIFDWE